MDYWLAFSLGLFGSLHCVGMCGPIVLAIPLTSTEKFKVVLQSLLYNLGRIITYGIMGMLMGLLGWGVYLTGYQNWISIGLGIALILMAVFSFSAENYLLKKNKVAAFFTWVKNKLAKSLSISSRSSAIKIGMINGLLPCGLVYVALAGAVTTGGWINGSIYMLLFGLGTIPLMLAVMVFGKLNQKFIFSFRKIIPFGLVLFGLYLIYRGFMLEVPEDLEIWRSNNFKMKCH